jgi:hypothetical protein
MSFIITFLTYCIELILFRLGIFKLYEPDLLKLKDFIEINNFISKQNSLLYNWEELFRKISDISVDSKEVNILRSKASIIVVEKYHSS